ncbi:type II secretion system F family protein [Euzebya tangerina]|uniref:type II secretion system F family protein n=1 Tax=Euzebya tangerina TaxID=591198 RepID=UPI000E30B9B7|nr:type II secretion system F family protein [Euzebya tangerina]
MIGLAVVCSGLFAALAVAAVRGQLPVRRAGRPRREKTPALQDLIAAAGLGWSPSQVVAGCLAAALAVGVVITSLTPIWALAGVPVVVAAAAPIVMLRTRARGRLRAIRSAWPDALAQIAGSLRAGRPLSHALIDVSLNGPPALTEPLSGLAARIQTVGLVPALEAARDELSEPLTDRIVEVLTVAHVEGGRIVLDIIDDLSRAVEDELAVAEETETLALEGKLNARLVFALPWLVLVVLTARPGPFQDFYASGAGALVIGIGTVMSLAGVAISSRLSRTPDPVRVLIPEGAAS